MEYYLGKVAVKIRNTGKTEERIIIFTKYLCILFASLAATASGTTAVYQNTANAAISPNMVVGDTFTVTVTGAANATVTSDTPAQNGAPPGHFILGTTDSSGTWQATGHAVNIGQWRVTYSVANVAAPQNMFEVIDKPTGLTVTSVNLSSVQCASGRSGALGNIRYQITGANGNLISTLVPLTPFESGTIAAVFINGVQVTNPQSYASNVCGPSNFVPDCQNPNAASDGTFNDDPIGTCIPSSTFTQTGTTQNFSINIGNASYPVHSHTWTFTGTSFGHGTGSTTDGLNFSK